jgi:spore germination cell wall hydrolase CwlJ-like protein
MCLALNIFYEASHESIRGKEAIAHVTFNRSDSSDKSTCGVVFERNQFSWTSRFVHKPVGEDKVFVSPTIIPSSSNPEWKQSLDIAYRFLHSPHSDTTHGAEFFHNQTVRPGWTKKMIRTAVIGNHFFYRQSKFN